MKMTSRIHLICPADIKTYYIDEINNLERARRSLHAENIKKNRIISLVAEEKNNGVYVLLEKFEYLAALNKISPNTRVPVHVYPPSSEKERLIHILTYSIPLEKGTSWLFKNFHINKLMNDHYMKIEEIANATRFDESIIKRYLLDERIPEHIRNRAIEVSSKTIVQKICQSKVIPLQIKEIIYEKAILENDNPLRLTLKRFEYLKDFFNANSLPKEMMVNLTFMENMIDDLIYTNFDISYHMKNIYKDYWTIRRVK